MVLLFNNLFGRKVTAGLGVNATSGVLTPTIALGEAVDVVVVPRVSLFGAMSALSSELLRSEAALVGDVDWVIWSFPFLCRDFLMEI